MLSIRAHWLKVKSDSSWSSVFFSTRILSIQYFFLSHFCLENSVAYSINFTLFKKNFGSFFFQIMVAVIIYYSKKRIVPGTWHRFLKRGEGGQNSSKISSQAKKNNSQSWKSYSRGWGRGGHNIPIPLYNINFTVNIPLSISLFTCSQES